MLVATLLAAGPVAARERGPVVRERGPVVRERGPVVELLTMGPGDDVFERFGHAALLVHWPSGREDVFNYGYADFTDPWVFLSFLRGRVRFWVASSSFTQTWRDYTADDRSIYRQRLNLTAAEHRELARLLEENVRPEHRYFIYHHFRDNCSTRPRDLLDRVTRGALSRQLQGQGKGTTQSLRELVRTGFVGYPALLLASDLLLGRQLDHRPSAWAAAFLPALLRAGSERVRLEHGPLADAPQQLYRRHAADPCAGDARAGVKLGWSVTAAAALLGALLLLAAARGSRWSGAPLVLLALALALPALLVWSMALYSSLPELRENELLLALWPADALLVIPGVRWLRGRLVAGRLLQTYVRLRLAGLALVFVGHLCGVLYQQPCTWPVLAATSFGALALALRRPVFRQPACPQPACPQI